MTSDGICHRPGNGKEAAGGADVVGHGETHGDTRLTRVNGCSRHALVDLLDGVSGGTNTKDTAKHIQGSGVDVGMEARSATTALAWGHCDSHAAITTNDRRWRDIFET